jgi:hypothetical protein
VPNPPESAKPAPNYLVYNQDPSELEQAYVENKHPIPKEEDVATLSTQKLEDEITKTSTTKNPKAMHKSIY